MGSVSKGFKLIIQKIKPYTLNKTDYIIFFRTIIDLYFTQKFLNKGAPNLCVKCRMTMYDLKTNYQ